MRSSLCQHYNWLLSHVNVVSPSGDNHFPRFLLFWGFLPTWLLIGLAMWPSLTSVTQLEYLHWGAAPCRPHVARQPWATKWKLQWPRRWSRHPERNVWAASGSFHHPAEDQTYMGEDTTMDILVPATIRLNRTPAPVQPHTTSEHKGNIMILSSEAMQLQVVS